MKLYQITSSYIDTPYSEITCVDLIRKFSRELGIYFPEEEKIKELEFNRNKISVENHLEQYNEDPIKMQAFMLKLFLHFYDKVDIPIVGDVIMIKTKIDGITSIWPSVYIGRSLAIASFIDSGVITFRYRMIGKPFLILRLKKES